MIVIEIIWSLIKPLLSTKGASYIILAIITCCAIFYGGMHYEGLREDSRQKEAIGSAIRDFTAQAEKDGLFIKEVETIKIKIVEKEIEVMRDAVKTDLCINNNPTPRFRLLYNRSIGIANTNTAGKSNGFTAEAGRLIASK